MRINWISSHAESCKQLVILKIYHVSKAKGARYARDDISVYSRFRYTRVSDEARENMVSFARRRDEKEKNN